MPNCTLQHPYLAPSSTLLVRVRATLIQVVATARRNRFLLFTVRESVDPPSSKTHADPSRFLPFAVHESVDPPSSSSHADPSHFPLFTVLHEYMGHELLPATGYIPS
ncbi:uncharacterized protein F5147DRAFT_656685 [Suillus discolor]|uniref:Uncharacterized protein n=1 Tax=Suillus discolor TaxID=1912936 RepID=A0A9P7EXD9_9AGAM|nr:uncharacterized protein F5147DRAFT_656685 [Suillus discolor]KAG2096073.1 hypothetical protein F5147DRAFT_656685 [Suillus discolor]